MPYQLNKDLPAGVRKVLPAAAQTIYRKAFNSSYKEYYKNEGLASKIAWSAVKKSGYSKGQTKWTKKK